MEKVTTWTSGVNKLAEAAEFFPQAAFAALSKSMQFQWSYLQRVVPDCDSCFEVLCNALNDIFWPAVLQGTISDSEKKLFTLPARHGGMGIHDPLLTAASFTNSRKCTALIVDAIKCSPVFSVLDHTEHLSKLHRKIKQDIEIQNLNLLESILPTFDNTKKSGIQRGIDGKTSAWLTVIPLAHHHFDLSDTEFRDSLALRYHRPLLRLPALCDGCGSQFTTGHALDCRKGGLVIQRHNEIRDALGDLASIAYKEVLREPVIREPNVQKNVPALVADLSVRGVWQSQTTTFFDVRVVDSDASSYVQRDVNAVLSSIEHIKKQKYSQAAECVHASFTPFVVTADGALGVEGKAFMHLLSEKIAATWHKSNSEVMGYVRARLMFAILRATNLCVRGSRVKWRRRMEIEDGAGLPYMQK